MQEYDYFVAHRFRQEEKDDLRKAIESAFKLLKLKPYYADEEIGEKGKHILDKIVEKILETKFGIYDVTEGNPNVCLELGLAKGLGQPFYIICHNKSIDSIPSNLNGLDRIEFGSYKELTKSIKERILPNVLEMQKTIRTPKESVSLKEDENRLREHSKSLVEKNLNFRTSNISEVAFIKDSDLNLDILILLGTFSEKIFDKRYSKEVDAHIESGYTEVWKYSNERDAFINKHNKMAQIFLNNTVDKIKDSIKKKNPSFIEYRNGTFPNQNFIRPNYISDGVCYIIKYSYEKTIDIDEELKIMKEGNPLKIQIYQYEFAYSFEEKDLNEIKPIIITTLKEALKSEDFQKLKECHKAIKKRHNLYAKEIDMITKKVESGQILKGSCEICKELTKKLDWEIDESQKRKPKISEKFVVSIFDTIIPEARYSHKPPSLNLDNKEGGIKYLPISIRNGSQNTSHAINHISFFTPENSNLVLTIPTQNKNVDYSIDFAIKSSDELRKQFPLTYDTIPPLPPGEVKIIGLYFDDYATNDEELVKLRLRSETNSYDFPFIITFEDIT